MAIAEKKAENTYPLTVDYGRCVEDAVKLGHYDWANSNVNSRKFPMKKKGMTDIVVELVHFNMVISTNKALRELDKMGYRPVELYGLLAFGQKYSDVQCKFPVVALGSICRGQSGNHIVPYLYGRGSKRGLHLDMCGDDWLEICRFAAIRK